MALVPRSFPAHKRPLVNGILGFAQSFGLASAPVIGGALTDAFTWRACFGINVPIGILAVAVTAIYMKDLYPNRDLELPIREKFKRMDPIGTLLILPAIVCLMMALQWGETRFGWSDWRIVMLFVLFTVLITAFGYVQYQQQEKAVLPPRIIKNRTVLASVIYACCTNGILAVTEYYTAIYFQGVRGYSAAESGLLVLPMIVGFSVTSMLAALGTTWIGYYTRKYAREYPRQC
jgi:MFS family permease